MTSLPLFYTLPDLSSCFILHRFVSYLASPRFSFLLQRARSHFFTLVTGGLFSIHLHSAIFLFVPFALHHFLRTFFDPRPTHVHSVTPNSKSKIQWECQNGGQLWTPSAEAGYGTGDIPSTFCNAGFSSVNAAFIAALIVDLCFQVCLV